MRIVLFGAPGSGKGTQARILSDRIGIPMVSVGDILRNIIKSESELGVRIQNIIKDGTLLSDDLVTEITNNRLHQDDCKNGFILDGFPRTLEQAKRLNDMFGKMDIIIVLDVDRNEITRRICGRRVHIESGRVYHVTDNPPKHSGIDDITGEKLIQRDDDTEETISNRFNIYEKHVKAVISFYNSIGINVKYIDGMQIIRTVSDSIFRLTLTK